MMILSNTMKYVINLVILGILTLNCNIAKSQTFRVSITIDPDSFCVYPEAKETIFKSIRDTKKAQEHYKLIVKHSLLNNLNPTLISRQITKESRFKWWDDNKKTNYIEIAVGYMQVKPYWHHKLIRQHMSKKQKKIFNSLLLSTEREDYLIKMLKIPQINIPTGCKIMGVNKKTQRNYPLALIAYYAGASSTIHKELRKDDKKLLSHHYVKAVTGL